MAVIGLVGWLVVERRHELLALPLGLALVLSVGATVTTQDHLSTVGFISSGQATAASVVAERGDDAPPCLAHDRTEVASYVMWLYRMQLPALEHRRVDLAAGEAPCSELVIAHTTASVLAACDEATLLADEPRGSWGLWAVPAGSCA
jgi:hypothetical protein